MTGNTIVVVGGGTGDQHNRGALAGTIINILNSRLAHAGTSIAD